MHDEKGDIWQNEDQRAETDHLSGLVQQRDPQATTDVEGISVANISGPLVVLYGPPAVGKTATLLRLCKFLSSSYSIEIDQAFRSDPNYSQAVKAFDEQRAETLLAPNSTDNIDFLLLNVSHKGSSFCQILEAPGEHFFPLGADSRTDYPHYLHRLFQSSIRKTFVLFFERDLMADEKRLRPYAERISNTLRQHAGRRDKVIVLFNKSDQRSDLHRNADPVESEFKKMVYADPAVLPLTQSLRNGQFGRIPFVAFSSGRFGEDGSGRKTFAMSSDSNPGRLWKAISTSIKGSWWPW